MNKYERHERKRQLRTWLRRGITALTLSIVALVGIYAIGGVGIQPLDGFANQSVDPFANAAAEGWDKDSLNETEIEQQVHHYINQERAERGLSKLDYSTDLQAVARYHSEDMVTSGYYAHTSPSGLTFDDRYQRFNINCRVKTSSGTVTGAENIAYTFAGADIETSSGTVTNHDRNETKIAKGFVRQWMHSTGHRKNILRPYWTAEGVGVEFTKTDGMTKIYATQNFC